MVQELRHLGFCLCNWCLGALIILEILIVKVCHSGQALLKTALAQHQLKAVQTLMSEIVFYSADG